MNEADSTVVQWSVTLQDARDGPPDNAEKAAAGYRFGGPWYPFAVVPMPYGAVVYWRRPIVCAEVAT